ncbi:hypothetical protein [Actinomadura violacea]|uniref:Uncharacterized protein n=1 Tax=Actinomadura violacea TaxID=2819934 RepID=A0ABS3S3P4_9ACTN|nr:hypothetical protein [Actinomadura violacea]MBO2463624.1 hypothetical protein [Actinomadura violacea]
MEVIFERTGERRYAVVIAERGRATRRMDPAPGYDEHIPHDLVHYLTEAELGLASGVFGRAAAGGGGFTPAGETAGAPRERARAQRRTRRKEASLRRTGHEDMATSERLAGITDVAWRRRAGAKPPEWAAGRTLSPEDEDGVRRIMPHLDRAAALWHDLPVGGSLTFTWPSTTPAPSR